jgi:hypothetical protein
MALGPLAASRLEAHADPAAVAAILAACPVVDAPRRRAAERVVVLHTLCEEHTPPHTHHANVHHHFAVLIDCHMPLLMHPGKLTMSGAYILNLAPEQIPIGDIVTDHTFPLNTAAIEALWWPFITAAPETPTPPKPKPRKPTKVKRRSATEAIAVPPNGIIPLCGPLAASLPAYTNTDAKLYQKLLRKGMPRDTNYRSIRTLLTNAVRKPRNAGPLHILRMIFLGAYRYTTTLLPPLRRLQVYTASADVLMDRLHDYTNAELYTLLSEYLVAMARTAPHVVWLLATVPGWAAYAASARADSERRLRPTIHFVRKPLALPDPVPVAEAAPTPTDLFWGLLRVLQASGPPRRTTVGLAKTTGTPIYAMYKLFRLQAAEPRIYGAVLEACGVAGSDIALLRSTLATLQVGTMVGSVKEMVKAMAPVAVAVLTLYMGLLWQQSQIIIVPVRLQRPPIRKTRAIPYALVCKQCCTMRTQVRDTARRTRTDGIQLDTIRDSVMCTTCETPELYRVNLAENRVVCRSISQMKRRDVHVACRMCGFCTVYGHVIGCDELCVKCYNNARALFKARRCLCGVQFLPRQKMHSTLVASDPSGVSTLYALCDRHGWVQQHSTPSVLPAAYYLRLIAQTKSRDTGRRGRR